MLCIECGKMEFIGSPRFKYACNSILLCESCEEKQQKVFKKNRQRWDEIERIKT